MELVKRIFPPDTMDHDMTAVPAWIFSFQDTVTPIAFLWETHHIVAKLHGVKVAHFSTDGTLVWSYATGKDIINIEISSDGQFIAVASQDNTIYYFRSDGTLLWSVPFKHGLSYGLSGVRMSSDGHYLAATTRESTGLLYPRDKLFFFDMQGKRLWTWTDKKSKYGSIGDFAVSLDGQFVAAVVNDNFVKIFDRDGKPISLYDTGNSEEKIRRIAITEESRSIIVATKLSTIHCIRSDGKRIWKYPTDENSDITKITQSSTGHRFTIQQQVTNKVNVYSSSGELVRKFPVFRWWEFISGIEISPDGRYIAVTSDEKLHCLDIDSEFHWQYRVDKNEKIYPLSISPNNQHLIAFSLDNKSRCKLYSFNMQYYKDTPEIIRQKALDALGELQAYCTAMEEKGLVHGVPLQHLKELIDKQEYIETITGTGRWSQAAQSVKETSTRASEIIKAIPAPLFESLYTQGHYDEIIERYALFIEQKDRIQELIKTAETIGTLQDSLRTAAVSGDPEIIAGAFDGLEKFIREARPDIQLVLGSTHFSTDTWSKTPVEISNHGNAHAFGVSLAFSEEVETRAMHPADIQGRATITADVGIRPKAKGTTPVDVTVHYTDYHKKEYQQEFQFWIEIADQGSSFLQQAKASPDVPIYIPYGSGQFPPELSHRYTEPELIGSGGFARVFKAWRKDGQTVAVKVPICLDALTGKTFLAELRNWTRLNHPNIVKVYTFNILPVPYFEMELCDSSLSVIKKPVESEEAIWIVFNICEGIRFAHEKKIIHRDLKPQNILLKNGVPKISDWGLSRVVTESVSTTATSFTPQYAAPEQIGNKAKDERTDIWQIGVILYELVTGSVPFAGDSMIEIGMNIATKNPQLPSDINPRVKSLDPVIMRCLEKDPVKRYQSVQELQKALGLYLKVHYTESLNRSISVKDFIRSASYCGDLVVISLLTGDMPAVFMYTNDLMQYAQGDVASMARELSEQLHIRMDQGITEIPDELIIKAEFIAHKIRLGLSTT